LRSRLAEVSTLLSRTVGSSVVAARASDARNTPTRTRVKLRAITVASRMANTAPLQIVLRISRGQELESGCG
jgi:hypothetical protein